MHGQCREVWVRDLTGSWTRHFTLPMPLSTQENKRVLANCQGSLMNAGGNLVMDWQLIRGRGEDGSSNTSRYAKVKPG